MRTPVSSMLCFLIAGFLGALGQYLYKSGTALTNGTALSYLLNARLVTGQVCYIGVMTMFIIAFRRGGEMSVLYPLYATTFIWAAFISQWAYGIPVKPVHLAGMACLLVGMCLMGV